ncbi:penicillin-binding transpeptidase domain-containing protein [Oerskovia sp. M15]
MTPLQMAMVSAAIANGGKQMTPYTVATVRGADLDVVQQNEPSLLRTSVSPTVASQLTSMMISVVEGGSGKAAKIDGVQVAGKTGTAEHQSGAAPHAWFTGFARWTTPGRGRGHRGERWGQRQRGHGRRSGRSDRQGCHGGGVEQVRPVEGLSLGDRYRLVRRIAIGGMGEVWVANDGALGREVAVKVLREEYAGNEDFLERLRTEARNSAALSHPNIAQMYDYGEQNSSGYLVMELVMGEPMADLLEREPVLSPSRLLPILAQTARALHAAHLAGVVHRDVKPGNILLESRGVVKITDFGVSLAANQIPMTATGMVMGTAQYLSPSRRSARRRQARRTSTHWGSWPTSPSPGTGRSPVRRPSTSRLRTSTRRCRRCPRTSTRRWPPSSTRCSRRTPGPAHARLRARGDLRRPGRDHRTGPVGSDRTVGRCGSRSVEALPAHPAARHGAAPPPARRRRSRSPSTSGRARCPCPHPQSTRAPRGLRTLLCRQRRPRRSRPPRTRSPSSTARPSHRHHRRRWTQLPRYRARSPGSARRRARPRSRQPRRAPLLPTAQEMHGAQAPPASPGNRPDGVAHLRSCVRRPDRGHAGRTATRVPGVSSGADLDDDRPADRWIRQGILVAPRRAADPAGGGARRNPRRRRSGPARRRIRDHDRDQIVVRVPDSASVDGMMLSTVPETSASSAPTTSKDS